MPDVNSPAVQPTPNKKLVKVFDTEQETAVSYTHLTLPTIYSV